MRIFISAVVAAMLFSASSLGADDQKKLKVTPVKPLQSVQGVDTYKEYCASCHGLTGKGDGPAVVALKVAPNDLAKVSQRHNGKYPADWMLSMLQGKAAIAAHGTTDMPVWGPVFRSFESEQATRLRLFNLVEYIKTMQK